MHLVSLKEDNGSLRVGARSGPYGQAVRGSPSTHQRQRPQRKPTCPHLDLGFLASHPVRGILLPKSEQGNMVLGRPCGLWTLSGGDTRTFTHRRCGGVLLPSTGQAGVWRWRWRGSEKTHGRSFTLCVGSPLIPSLEGESGTTTPLCGQTPPCR